MAGQEEEPQTSFFSDPIKYIWGGNTGLSYGDLQHRRAIAQALASRKMGFPKNKGEGMTYLGESFNEGVQAMMLAREEAARARMLKGEADKTVGKLPSAATPTVTTEPPPDQTTTTTSPPPSSPPYKMITPAKPAPVVVPGKTSAADPTTTGNPNATFVPPWTPDQPDIPMTTGNAAVAARFPGSPTDGPARAVTTERIAPQAAADAPPPATESGSPPYTPRGLPLAFAARAPDSAFQDSIQTRSAPDLLEAGPNSRQMVFAPPTEAPQQMAFAPEEPLVPETGGGGDTGGGGVPPDTFVGPMDDPKMQARERAIAGIESGGSRNPYGEVGIATKGGNALGKFQVMSNEIPERTQAALGYKMTPQEFLNNPNAQHIQFRQQFGDAVKKYGEEGAARNWYGGDRGMYNLGATDAHGRLSVLGYGRDYMNRLGQPPGADEDKGYSGTSVATAPQSSPGAGTRDDIAIALMEQGGGVPQQPEQQQPAEEQPQDTSSEAKLLELVGGGRKPGSPFRATASLNGRGGAPTASDAPQPGLQPMGALGGLEASAAARRDAIAGGLSAQPAPVPAQEVPPPPPDPTQPGTLPSPTTSGPPQPTGASPIQLAQAGPLDPSMFSPQPVSGAAQGIGKAPAGPPAPSAGPAPMVPAGQQTPAPAGWVPLPKPTPPRPQVRAGYQPEEIDAIKRKMMSPNDPDVAATQQPIIDAYAAARKAADDREAERWRADVTNYNALEKARLEHEAQRPKEEADVASTRQKTSEAIEKAALQQRLGGRDPEEFFKTFDKDHAEAQSAALVLRNNALALRAINDGVVTGWGANFRVDAKRLAAFALQNGMAGNEAANTQFLKAILTGSLGQAVRDIQGDGRNSASNTDVALAGRAAGSDPTLELGAIKRIIHAGNRISTDKINDFEDQRDTYFKNTNSERRYQLRGAEPKEPAYVEKLLGAPTKENKAAYDERFGEGSSDLEIARAKRRGH